MEREESRYWSVRHVTPNFPLIHTHQAEEEREALKSSMEANQADQQNLLLQREQALQESASQLQSQIDEIKEEHRVQYSETTKERDRLIIALKEAEQKTRDAEHKLAEMAQRQDASLNAETTSSAAQQLEHQAQMDAIKSKMSHLEKTNAELTAKNEELTKEKTVFADKEAKFSETMMKGEGIEVERVSSLLYA